MSTYLPAWVGQLDGSAFAGENCTCAVGAIALDRETLGAKTSTGAIVRNWTGDKTGGTRQSQVVDALERAYNVHLTLDLNVPKATALARLDAGMGMMLAGQSSATRGTRWQASETFGGNHQWWCNERRKNSQVSGGYEWRIYDPLGDHRRPGIADFRNHGLWLPEAVVLDFARRLNVSATPNTSYVPLGYGKFYAVFTHDTEPHLELRFGATAIKPPQVRKISVPAGQRANVRSGPGRKYRVVRTIANGGNFGCYQKTHGERLSSGPEGDIWYGNINGGGWTHSTSF